MLAVLCVDINLMPDWTLFVQLGVFLLTLIVLHLLVFRPVLRVLDRRRSFTDDAIGDAAQKNAEADRLEAERKKEITRALKDAEALHGQRIAATRRGAEAILTEAKAQMKSLLDSSEVSVESSEAEATVDISRRAEELAHEIVARVTNPGPQGRA